MRTYNPTSVLKESSWSEDFTPSQYLKDHFMFVQCIGHYYAKPDYAVSARQNLNSYLLLYTVEGCGILKYHDHTFFLPEGMCALFNCNEAHSYRCFGNNEWNIRWIHFSGHCITGYLTHINKYWQPVHLENGEQHFLNIYKHLQQTDFIHEIEISTMLINLCTQIITEMQKDQSATTEMISPVVKSTLSYIEEHFTENISLDNLSQELKVSKYYLSHLFKSQTGSSPHEYLITTRLSYAKSLLRCSSRSISEIAEICGFESSSHFIQIFKKRECTTPLKYRTFHRELLNE